MTYSELQVTTHFSFLRGASAPGQLFATAALMGMPALGITDRNSMGGIVRSLVAAEEVSAQHAPIRLVTGCRLDLVSGASLLVWPEDLAGWSRLTRLLTRGKLRADAQHGEKGQCFLHWEDVAAHSQGLVAALVPGLADFGDPAAFRWMADIFGGEGHVALTHHRRPDDALRLHRLAEAAGRYGLVPIATGDVLYHAPDRRMLQDVMTAIRHRCTIDDLGFRRERHADRHLQLPDRMARRFAQHPHALHAVEAVVERCTFSPRELKALYRYPDEVVMSGRNPQQALARLAQNALAAKFPDGAPAAYAGLLDRELELVRTYDYAPYFLTVNSIVQFARTQNILCQGRGSAANSLICYLLGITSIDPVQNELLFERFISGARNEPPDIDVDFEHERREEVIQWIYETYGQDHAALAAVVSRFRARGSVREVGKAMGLPEDLTGALAGQVWGWSEEGVGQRHVEALNLDAADPRIARTLELAQELIGTPRHLSQHPGGFVLAHARLDDIVPIEPAAMVDRRVVEWEKDDIEELGLMKVDILGLGMLGCMRRAFDLLAEHKGVAMTLSSDVLQQDDSKTFAMIRRADTLGVFQIESRAQMAMLPRMKPKEFYDLVIEVAIVRPGPIQGDMVHPYLRRREGKETPEYPKPELEAVLRKTLGVPLFQEQAMKVAIVGAGFTPAEADALRRAMATFKFTGGVSHFRDKLVQGMVGNGYTRDFAERTFKQIEGFGSYGFPESHAASFAKIAYASSWMKCHHPDVFCAALLNAQPMGFYAPAQIVRDAREHGVEVRPVCINDSRWDTRLLGAAQEALALEAAAALRLPLRLGFKVVHGLSNADAARLVIARGEAPFTSVEDAWRRSGVPLAALEKIARADGFQALGLDRRQALWAIKGLAAEPLPLFAAADAREGGLTPEVAEAPVALEPLTAGREVVEDYRATQLSLRAHPLAFLRAELEAEGVVPCKALGALKDGRRVEVAGVILVRQKPGSAKGVLFLTIEDETGVANAILWPDRFEKQRRTVMSAAMVSIVGRVQREGEVIHVITDRVVDRTPMLRSIGDIDLPRLTGRGDGATNGGGPDPRDPREPPVWTPRSHYHRPFRTGCDPEQAIPIRSRDFH
ncbi:error-prone DNA polymerase [Sphingomonas sp. ac-8]|uniref:error-prone DNA polymerase n=1 Tax=Sphingomonas sp. ac-8 TaxID=3242977 RepID=UPI003A804A56